ncbi:hypothetical protein ACFYE9_24045 [Rhizobium leguminosarum]|uniref:Uncharacterized protein n=1 Tax=Rhizobium leguminosarum TaxID=384 RepID=A0ACD5EZN9_RHILE|nr:hypothetical protein [Rhizobium leguminosarum]
MAGLVLDRSSLVIWMSARRLQGNASSAIRWAALDLLELEWRQAPTG